MRFVYKQVPRKTRWQRQRQEDTEREDGERARPRRRPHSTRDAAGLLDRIDELLGRPA